MCTMTPEDFVSLYEQALAAQDWSAVDPLVHEDEPAVRRAFEQNFAAIADEEYRISNVHWVHRGDNLAVYLFDFHWTGRINDRPASGSGRGTAVLHREDGRDWTLLVEHLGPAPP
jgi:hypothetical protein